MYTFPNRKIAPFPSLIERLIKYIISAVVTDGVTGRGKGVRKGRDKARAEGRENEGEMAFIALFAFLAFLTCGL